MTEPDSQIVNRDRELFHDLSRAMHRAFLLFLFAVCFAAIGWTKDPPSPSIKCASPDGHFAMRIVSDPGDANGNRKIELIDKASDKTMRTLGSAAPSQLADTVLVWSADSKRVAYGSHDNPPGTRIDEGSVVVYFWNGEGFDQVPLPDNLPTPDIQFPDGIGDNIKPYGGLVRPLQWLKSGDLEVSSDDLMLSRTNGKSYRGIIRFTIAFDEKHVPSVKTIGKSVTRVSR